MLGWVAGKVYWPTGWAQAPQGLSTTLQRPRETSFQAKEPVVSDRELSQNCPSVARLRDGTRDLATSAALKRFENLAGCAARETSCLRCKKPKLQLGTIGSRFRVRSRLLRMSA